ncbi:hypothetical protein SAMN05216276_1008130 [Streptosporangium subroseum]|uniref:Uncharacterized protein n=1 Tax=Streptosporangium subroseum TaxID=106412 RepID=A0A239DY23_9ACTN|nr:hypothetical protein [Streptosporangium subroseum]SNS37405.1 hypothetical protein SAMN05216276_1008130 [Streptosporangium subroseum]
MKRSALGERRWDEDRGGEYASWGTSTFYPALDEEGYAHVQVEVYANGTVIAYDSDIAGGFRA